MRKIVFFLGAVVIAIGATITAQADLQPIYPPCYDVRVCTGGSNVCCASGGVVYYTSYILVPPTPPKPTFP